MKAMGQDTGDNKVECEPFDQLWHLICLLNFLAYTGHEYDSKRENPYQHLKRRPALARGHSLY